MSPFVTSASLAPFVARLHQAIALLLLLLLAACYGGNSGLPDPPAPAVTAPTITVQPNSRITDEGVAVTFSVQATGSGTLTYQWLRDDNDVPGATQASYTLSAPAASDNGSLWKVRISNEGGSITSSTLLLTVNIANAGIPIIDTEPQSQTVTAGSNASFSVTASSSTPLSYQWQRNGSDVAGATSATYSLTPAEESDSASVWNVIVTNASGSVSSANATLTVNPGIVSAPTIQTHPVSQTVATNSIVTFTVTASGSPAPTFQWQRDGSDISGATTSQYATGFVDVSDSGSTWRVIVSNSAGSITSGDAILTVQPPSPAATAVVAVVAGVLNQSSVADGTPGSFKYPAGMSVDAGGNLFVADLLGRTIRRISSAGSVSTLAGLTDNGGANDGDNSTARFNLPAGIALDAAGTIYVSDIGNHNIRTISPGGSISTIAGGITGTSAAGYVDGAAGVARFKTPWGIAVDSSGTVYVADTGNHVIRMINSAGMVSTLAGVAGSPGAVDGTDTNARFKSPTGIVIGTDGNLYVADQGNNTIRKVTTAGNVSTLAGAAGIRGNADGTASDARFSSPTGLCTDNAGNLYISDTSNHLIRKITPSGEVSTVAGNSSASHIVLGVGGTLNQPIGITINNSSSTIYTTGESAVLSITP